MISILQLIIVLFLPAFMIIFAITRKKELKSGEAKGWNFKFKKQELPEELDKQLSLMFCNIILFCGINVGAASLIFALFVLFIYGTSWIMCIAFVLAQLLAGIASFSIVLRTLPGRFNSPEETDETDETEQDDNDC